MNNELEKLTNESMLDFKYRLLIEKAKGELSSGWDEVAKSLNIGLSNDTIRKGSIFLPEFEEYMINKLTSKEDIPNYKETIEVKRDGTTSSDKLIELSQAQMKDSEYILKAHGFDPLHFELIGAKHSVWNVSAGNNPNKTLYSSKVSVKPKSVLFDIDKVIDKATKNVKPYKTNKKVKDGKNLLEIFLTDMHFGVNDFEYYQDTLTELLDLIYSKEWDTIYIPIGSDLLHNDDFKGRTTNDTMIEKVDMEKAWEEAFNFYSIILQSALRNSVNVVAHYVCGNHDKVMSYGLVKALSKVYTEVQWDTTSKNKKLFTWKDVAILVMHGDKGTGRISKTIYKEFGKIIANKKVVEIHSGDKHHIKTDDVHGVVFRILPTKAQTDEWHDEQSFTGSTKAFHIFEYKEDMLKTIYHI